MKNPFKKFTIALTGEFGPGRSHEKMRDWIEANGGTFAKQISADVTHLVCSLKDWKKAPKIVKEALKIKSLKIVTFDWFEDSLMQHSPKREGPYLLKRVAKKTARKKAQTKRKVKRAVKEGSKAFAKGCKAFKDEIHAQGYHIYRDLMGFAYDVVLARADLATNKNERYVLKLYESHTPPHLYATYATYSSALLPRNSNPDEAPAGGAMKAAIARTLATASDIRAPVGSTFEVAVGAFRGFFRAKTGGVWEGRGGKGEEGRFVYVPPLEDGEVGVAEGNGKEGGGRVGGT